MDKWIDKAKDISIKRVNTQELDRAFDMSIKRKVKNDSTISVNSIIYEVPPTFIGKTIELRHPYDDPEQLTVYEEDKPVCAIKKINLQENASPPSWEIHFHKKGGKS